mmetsp:Transcript_2438/g.2389  ORF Transcript_2438/g.2389 Transcript_2438/m.2389 type:complete len:164 (+) Transcript_2438:384-875(+)
MMFYHFETMTESSNYTVEEMPQSPIYGLSHLLSLEYNLKGYMRSTSNSCAASLKNGVDGFRLIKDGYQDVVIAGGFDECSNTYIDFGSIYLKANGRNPKEPHMSLRAFDKDSKGSTVGNGGGFMVLESLDSALKRGAPILAEVVGGEMLISGNSPLQPSLEGI